MPSTMSAAGASLLFLAIGCGDHDWQKIKDEIFDHEKGSHPGEPRDAGALCPAIAYATNGVCEAPPGCERNDPEDCQEKLSCTFILHPSDGVCEAAPGCPEQDPDDCASADGGRARACGSRGLAQCEASEFCNFPPSSDCGETDKPGLCQVPTQACTREYNPVCGCDGQTYGNACTAAAARVSVRAPGPCVSEGDGGISRLCGGYAGLTCPVSEFCDYPPEAQCGAGDHAGTCKPLPSCTPNFDPVCGCDGRTYEDECQAHAAGISVQHQGTCAEEEDGGTAAQLCGGFAGLTCPPDQFCDFPPATRCGSGDQTGTCEPRPDFCTAQYDPVCGCDGQTHSNRCAAASAGVSIAHDGEC
jgi:hypothetical protein